MKKASKAKMMRDPVKSGSARTNTVMAKGPPNARAVGLKGKGSRAKRTSM